MSHEHDPVDPSELAARAPSDAQEAPEGAAAPHPPVEDDLNTTEENADRPAPAEPVDGEA